MIVKLERDHSIGGSLSRGRGSRLLGQVLPDDVLGAVGGHGDEGLGLGGATCLALLVQCGLLCFLRHYLSSTAR